MKSKYIEDDDYAAMFPGCRVIVRNNNISSAIQKLKRKVSEESILQEYHRHSFYMKPGERRRRAAAAARKRHLRDVAQREDEFNGVVRKRRKKTVSKRENTQRIDAGNSVQK